MITTESSPPTHRRNSGGPPLALLGFITTALFVASLIAGAAIAKTAYPSPFDPASKTLDYFAQHRDAVRVTAMLQFASAIPLAIYAATASARLRNLGLREPGSTIALVGGTIASASLLVSAMINWVLSRPDVASEPTIVRSLSYLSFMAGGPGSVVPLGLLLAGIAVPALLGRLAPRPLAAIGLPLALAAEVSTLTFVANGAAFLLPVSRFGGYLWLIAIGVALPRVRRGGPDT